MNYFPVSETSLREYLLKAGWSSGLFCSGYEESLHGQTGSVFGFHLLLQQNPRTSASRGRNAAVLPSLPPPSVHQMILTLETRGLIERTPGQARSIRLLISREELPDLI